MQRPGDPGITRRQFIQASAAAVAGLAAYGCAPTLTPAGERSDPSVLPLSRSAQATVRLGRVGSPTSSVAPTAQGTSGGGSGGTGSTIAHAALSVGDHNFNVVPMLAERLPSIDDGTWVVNPNGTMQVTWHLRKNVKWHDGHPFTARDVRFSWEFANDRSLPLERNPFATNVTAMDLPDEHTVVMHWAAPNRYAHFITTTDFFIYPEHIVRPLWESGAGDQMFATPFFQEQFVGLGPYKVDRFNVDGTVVFKPFEDFFLGPPKIGTVVIHRADNTLGLVTLLLAEAVHINYGGTLEYTDAVTVQEQWEANGTGIVHFTPTGFERLFLRQSNPLFRDVRVRRALLHAIDREQIVKTFFQGKAPLAHTLLHPREMGYAAAEAAVTKYPFDPRLTLALFEAAGWQRGTDGVLANAAGERFEIKYRASLSDAGQVRVQGAIIDFWKDVGVRASIDNVSDAVAGDRRDRALYTGITGNHAGTTIQSLYRRWHSNQIPREENRYTGDNGAQWNNPEADRLLGQLESTIDPQATESILVQIAKVFSDDLPALPLFYALDGVAIHKNLTNAYPRPINSGPMMQEWQVHRWEWS